MVFVSDVHLGSRYSCADEFLEFLSALQPEQLYLVGDFIDGWLLWRRWRWRPEYNRILTRLFAMSRRGTKLYYTPVNHDEFLRGFPLDLGFVEIADEFIHETTDGRQFLVTHGDRIDRVECEMPWLSMCVAFGYNLLLSANGIWNRLRRGNPRSKYQFSSAVKSRVKHIVRFISDFENRLITHARSQACQGVICGHIHAPKILRMGNMHYFNTGDWVEHCTALIEDHDGTIRLVRFGSPVEEISRHHAFPPIPVTGSLQAFSEEDGGENTWTSWNEHPSRELQSQVYHVTSGNDFCSELTRQYLN